MDARLFYKRGKNLAFTIFTDTNWGGDIDSIKLIRGHLFSLKGTSITWSLTNFFLCGLVVYGVRIYNIHGNYKRRKMALDLFVELNITNVSIIPYIATTQATSKLLRTHCTIPRLDTSPSTSSRYNLQKNTNDQSHLHFVCKMTN